MAGRQQAPPQLTKHSACHGSCKPKIIPKPAAHQLPNCWQSDNSSSQFGSKRFSALSRHHHLGFLERPRESQSAQSFLSPAMRLICNCTRWRAQKIVVDCSTPASGRFSDKALSLAPTTPILSHLWRTASQPCEILPAVCSI